MKLMKRRDIAGPAAPADRRVVEDPFADERRRVPRPRISPPPTVYVRTNTRGNSDLPIRDPDGLEDFRGGKPVGTYVSPITGEAYPCSTPGLSPFERRRRIEGFEPRGVRVQERRPVRRRRAEPVCTNKRCNYYGKRARQCRGCINRR